MLPAFILCHSEHYTLEKFIFYVKELNSRLSESSIFSNEVVGEPKYQFAVNGITKLEGRWPVWLEDATHKVTAIRITPAEHNSQVTFDKGTAFFILSQPVGEYDKFRSLGILPIDSPSHPALSVHVLREIIVGLDNSAPYHYLVRCTPEQRRVLSASMIADAESCGLVVVADEVKDSKEPFDFVQWYTGARLYFEDADYFFVGAARIREHSIIGVDNKQTHDARVTRIEGNIVYVRAFTNDMKKDIHQGGEYQWEGKFIVLNY